VLMSHKTVSCPGLTEAPAPAYLIWTATVNPGHETFYDVML
jgi:hypothetical protein